jgi:hypothetical protein
LIGACAGPQARPDPPPPATAPASTPSSPPTTPSSNAAQASDVEASPAGGPEAAAWSLWQEKTRAQIANRSGARDSCAGLSGAEQLRCTCQELCHLSLPPLPPGAAHAQVAWPPLIAVQVNDKGAVESCGDHDTKVVCTGTAP